MRWVFAGFELDPEECRLFRDGRAVPLERRALDLLIYLAERPERLIRKEELIADVWKTRSLSPGVLANTVRKLRIALGQAAHELSPIETVHGRGYRFRGTRLDSGDQASSASVGRAPAAAWDPWIGRPVLLSTFEELLEQVAQGRGRVLVLSGDAGVGKTRSLARLCASAEARGFSAWRGAAYEGAGAPPYWPWIEVLRASHAELAATSWREHVPHDAKALAGLVPHLLAQDADTDQAGADPLFLRFRLFDELTSFLRSASAQAPRLVLLDDLHWADVGTIELLAHVARALPDCALLLAATLRDRDHALDEQRRAALRRLSPGATRVRLRGLLYEEVAELAQSLSGAPLAEPSVLALVERTGGNPFFIRQVLELVRQRGGTLDASALGSLELPAAIADVIRQRTDALDPGTRRMLAKAAVIGGEFDVPLLAEVLAQPPGEVLATLEPARRMGLIEPHPELPERLAFDHALVRETLRQELGLEELGDLHGKLASALAARASSTDSLALAEVARHALAAVPCDLAWCLAQCLRAADAARAASGFESAAEILVRAREKLACGSVDDATRCELSLQIGIDQYYGGDLIAAFRTLDEGARLAQALGRGDLLAQFLFRLIDCAEGGGGDEGRTRDLLEQALQMNGESAPHLYAALLAHRAELALELPFAARIRLLDEAERLAGDSPLELRLEIANCRAAIRDPTQLEHSRQAAAKLRALTRMPPANMNVRFAMRRFAAELTSYLYALTSGDLALADEFAREANAVAAEARLVPLLLLGEAMLAGRALAEGRMEDLECSVTKMRERCAQLTGGLSYLWLPYSLFVLHTREPGAHEIQLPAGELFGRSRHNARAYVSIAWLLARMGRIDSARAMLARVSRAELAQMPVSYGDLGTLCQLAESYCMLGELDEARALRAKLGPHAAKNAVGPCLEYFGAVAHFLGVIALELDEYGEAAELFADAQRMNERLRMPLQAELSRALRERALARESVRSAGTESRATSKMKAADAHVHQQTDADHEREHARAAVRKQG